MKENNIEVIKSSQNARVKRLRRLMKSPAERNAEGVYPVEGIRMAREIPSALVEELYLSESAAGAFAKEIPAGVSPVLLGDDLFRSVSDTRNPQGILAIVRKKQYTMEDLTAAGRPLVILEALQDPGNMGTILRSLEAAGGGGLLCDPACADIYSLKTLRSTMGAVFRMPHLTAGDLAAAVSELKRCGYRIYAAHLSGKCAFTGIKYTDRSAFLIGNEGRGLTEETAALADEYVRIPMEGSVESLNAAVAASLLLYEVKRQQRP